MLNFLQTCYDEKYMLIIKRLQKSEIYVKIFVGKLALIF